MSQGRGRRGFGYLRKLPSRRWQASYVGPDGGRHSAPVTYDSKLDAEAWLIGERRLMTDGQWRAPAERAALLADLEQARLTNTFAVYAQTWLEGRHDLRPSTRASYRTALRRHLIPAFGPLPLADISTDRVRAWFAGYGSRIPTARAHAYQVLGSIMAQAEDDGLITRSPCRIRAGGRSRPRREPEVLSLDELLLLAEAMPQRHRAFTLLCGLCGLRFGEAAALRRRDLDLQSGVVHVTRTAVRADGTKTTGPPKSRAGLREVAMPTLVVEAIRTHMARYAAAGRDGLVFPGRDGDLLAPTALYGRSSRVEARGDSRYQKAAYGFFAAREAIDRPHLHWHDLRRTAATLGAQSGATVREMQHRLGHTTPTMALLYQSATAERDRAIANRLQATIERRELGQERLRRHDNQASAQLRP